ncbi:unnamed protein product [Lymnaea stagnalis]|uniref:Uncharacterized protein n=1 Tax=Lymnaea stagnalis TaxID=6523 RepID=A0AAV2HTQ2_LYMST
MGHAFSWMTSHTKNVYLLLLTFTSVMVYLLSQQYHLLVISNYFPTFLNVPGHQASANLQLDPWNTKHSFLRLTNNKVDTSGASVACVFPQVNPFDPQVMHISGLHHGPLRCDGFLPDLTYLDGHTVRVNKTKFKADIKSAKVTCRYQVVLKYPRSDFKVKFGNWSDPFTEFVKLSEDVEFVHVVCKVNSSAVVSKSYLTLVPRRPDVNPLYAMHLKKREKVSAPKETLNVVMIGFDGTSRAQFLRAMQRTYAFLMKDLGSFDMSMYTQVGGDTFGNYLPLLTGLPVDAVSKWWSFSNYSDPLDLIWQPFEQAGYRTLYTEDFPSGGGFHYRKKGFMLSPTSYYSRPMTVAMENDTQIWKSGKHCVGSKPEFMFHMDYVKQFLDTFPKDPVYAMAFLTKLTHDDMTLLKQVDEHMLGVYTELQVKGHLNRTLLITFSDHGPRFGQIRYSFHGMVESRTPYAIFTFPKWFLEKYPDVAKNLKTNTGRLTTHFDTHATLQDLMYFKSTGEIPLKPSKHGISLFQEIPKDRTCEEIPIPPEFCLCGQHGAETIDATSPLSKRLANSVMLAISSQVNTTLCENLKLETILQVTHVKLADAVSKGFSKRAIFKIRLQTVPGHGIFEATVFVDAPKGSSLHHVKDTTKVDVGEVIERMNLYRGQAECVSDATQRLFCYCKTQVSKSDIIGN